MLYLKLRIAVNTALQLQEQLIRLQDLATTLEPEQMVDWEEKTDALQQRLYTLQLSEDNELQTLAADINTARENLKSLGATALPSLQAKGVGEGSPPELGLIPEPSSGSKPRVMASQWGSRISNLWRTAPGRLRLFYAASYLISFILLAGGGFNELYLSKPTFGAKGLGDYFSLLVLGFGAEATRNVITQVAQKTDEAAS